jgi:hypothetical protein
MPGLVKVRTKAEAPGVFDKPAIDWSVDLEGAIRVVRIDWTAPYIKIQSAAGEVWTVNCEARAACIR